VNTAVADAKPRRSEPRERLLRVASDLFYSDGINTVGVERILAEADVTRATLYRHFAGKEGLVEAYLEREDQTIRGYFADAETIATSPQHYLELAVAGVAQDALRHHTRGCPFINASAEYSDPKSPIRERVNEHRVWFRQALEAALESAGKSDPTERAAALVLLRDGALVGGYLDGSESVSKTFVRQARLTAGLE
jgi:AcrR family transcriptional regulator